LCAVFLCERNGGRGIAPKKGIGIIAKAFKIIILQGARIGQHLKRKRDSLHLGVEYGLDAFHRLQDAIEGGIAVAYMVDVNQAPGE
jgi:hypothetical protein